MAGYDRIVAVDENHMLPPETRSALLDSEQFGTSAVQHITDRSKAPGAAFQTHIQAEVTEPGKATHDALMRLIEDDASEAGGGINDAIKSLLAAADATASIFIPAIQFSRAAGVVMNNLPGLSQFVGLQGIQFPGTSRVEIVFGGVMLPASWARYDIELVYIANTVATAPNNGITWSVYANALVDKVDEFFVYNTKPNIPSGDPTKISTAVILEDVEAFYAPQILKVIREGATDPYNDTVYFLGARLIKSS